MHPYTSCLFFPVAMPDLTSAEFGVGQESQALPAAPQPLPLLFSFFPPWIVLPHSKDRCSPRARGSSPQNGSLQEKLVLGPHITCLFFLVTIDAHSCVTNNLILLMTVIPSSQRDIFNS